MITDIREVTRDFAYAAFSADHGNDIFNVRQIVQWFDQTLLRSFAAAAVCAACAVAVTRCAHFLPLFFPPLSLYPRRCSVFCFCAPHEKKRYMPRHPSFFCTVRIQVSQMESAADFSGSPLTSSFILHRLYKKHEISENYNAEYKHMSIT